MLDSLLISVNGIVGVFIGMALLYISVKISSVVCTKLENRGKGNAGER